MKLTYWNLKKVQFWSFVPSKFFFGVKNQIIYFFVIFVHSATHKEIVETKM